MSTLAAAGLVTVACLPTSSSPTGTDAGGVSAHWSGLAQCTKPPLTAYHCGTLSVPLDRTVGPPNSRGTLDLSVLVAENPTAPRTLLFLTGGPGQPGPDIAPRALPWLSDLGTDYKVVMLDQRGTGDHALACPKLQDEIGFSDLEIPKDDAVTSCATALGAARAQYSTTATVADLDELRRALKVDRWSIDGVSYGTYTAQRYAAAHRDRVDRLVLDSIVPVDGFDPTMVDAYAEVAPVLRDACAETGCGSDPAEDLAAVVAGSPGLGPRLLDVLSVMSVVNDTFVPMPDALHAAAAGDEGPLRGLLDGWQEGTSGPANKLSQGLHASTLCLDIDFPWGGAQAPEQTRAAALDRAVARLTSAQLWPFNAETARTNGFMRTCELWPREPDGVVPASELSLRGVKRCCCAVTATCRPSRRGLSARTRTSQAVVWSSSQRSVTASRARAPMPVPRSWHSFASHDHRQASGTIGA